ncbi:phosphoglycerate mutase-like protein [Thozetella sp. PMI_491]|nr:phosphoglycerate mutase-like protein [Thozetella sp. PMI_491]
MAALFTLAIGLASLVAPGSAQSTRNEVVWSSVAFILYGERTPLDGPNTPSLTPYGAQQMYNQGAAFRSRYLDKRTSTNDSGAPIGQAYIDRLEVNAIDNEQLTIYSSTDTYTSASAMAFMQGLYPPSTSSFTSGTGGVDAARLANGTVIDFPLNGYQYPNIRVTSVQDPDSIWLQGHVSCTQYTASLLNFRTDQTVTAVYQNTLNFYQTLWAKFFSENVKFPSTRASFWNAYELWDWAAYQYRHDNATQNYLTAEELAWLGEYASLQQQDMNGNLSASGLVPGDMIRAIAGRTLATRVRDLLLNNIANNGTESKLNLLFSSYEPFIAFFALSRLISGPSGAVFEPLPNPGAAMVFELFSIGNDSSVYPDERDLWVRFLYRNGTDPSVPLVAYSLFGNGVSQMNMQFNQFAADMAGIGIGSIANWCSTCQGVNLFCTGLQSTGSSNPTGGVVYVQSGQLSPAVSGIIGAALTIFLVGLVLLARRVLAGKKAQISSVGGFKGAEKMASDTDIAYAKSGVRHERVGSWELRGGGSTGAGSSSKDVEEGITTVAVPVASVTKTTDDFSRKHDDDAMSYLGHKPVEPREEV